MKFKKIEYKNYRCFLTGTIDFSQKDNKTLNILIGPNGGGKTEVLFSFWWGLYDLNFKDLQGKQNTSYALNSDLYQALQKSPNGTTEECYVRILFENNGKSYAMTRKCIYIKDNLTIQEESTRSLSEINDNGEFSVPIKNSDDIDKVLEGIIPKSIMSGIIFDGERIQKLSSPEQKSKQAISGVIEEITNVSLLIRANSHFEALQKNLNKSLKNIPSFSRGDIERTVNRIEELQTNIKQDKELLINLNDELDSNTNELNILDSKLKGVEEIKELSAKRNEIRKNIIEYEDKLEECYKSLAASLKDGYLLITPPLLDEVDSLLEKYDVPQDLSADAITSILKKDTCICGRPIDEQARNILKKLIVMLPPNNMNSTLSETIRQTKLRIKELKNILKDTYNSILQYSDKINSSIEKRDYYTQQIKALAEAIDNDEITELENRRAEIYERNGKIKYLIPNTEQRMHEDERELEELRKQREELAQTNIDAENFTRQLNYIEKCQHAIEAIKESNKYKALHKINEHMVAAYETISEDAAYGRAIRLIKYDPVKQYSIDTYSKIFVQKLLNKWKESGDYDKYLSEGMNEDQIFEKAILSEAQSDSTGQMKIKTLAFIKAILEYSNQLKDKDSFEIKKEYPLLIDSPFGDIADKNLSKAATALHEYSNQVILMIDGDKYSDLKKYFHDYENNIYYLQKVKDANHSIIIRSKEGN